VEWNIDDVLVASGGFATGKVDKDSLSRIIWLTVFTGVECVDLQNPRTNSSTLRGVMALSTDRCNGR